MNELLIRMISNDSSNDPDKLPLLLNVYRLRILMTEINYNKLWNRLSKHIVEIFKLIENSK